MEKWEEGVKLRYFKCFDGRKKQESSKVNNGIIAVFVKQCDLKTEGFI